MNKRQENKLSMYLAVQQVLTGNEKSWSGITAFGKAKAELSEIVASIAAARQTQETNTTGITADKAAKRQLMAEKAIEMSSAVQAYATDKKDKALFESVHYSISDLLRGNDTSARDHSQIIHDRAKEVLGSLADYGITKATLGSFQAAIKEYSDLLSAPRVAKTVSKTATDSLEKAFKSADDVLLNRLDKLMEQFRVKTPGFYEQYHNSRIIVDLGIRHENGEDEGDEESSPEGDSGSGPE